MRKALLLYCISLSVGWALPKAGPSLNVRLTTPLTSYNSATGSEFEAVVIAPYIRHGRILLPAGSIVFGTVTKSRAVGMAVVHERASLDLAFSEYELPDGRRIPFQATLRRIDNSRESVNQQGRIKGILAANSPQSLIHGLWHRPRPALFSRSFIGLTGAGGRIFTAYSMGPIGAAGLFAVRLAMFRLPEPEIQLPAGVEMKLNVTDIPEDAPSFDVPPSEPVETSFADWLASQPVTITKPGGDPSADKINVAFMGSKEQLANAFRAAGWFEAEPLTPRTFSRTYKNYARQTGYATAPVSKLLYEGAEPDFVFQKSFNTISMRHHVRVWRVEDSARELWLAAATHDIGAEFNKSAMTFTHKIDRRIDAERSKVANDLLFVNCVEAPRFVERPDVMSDRQAGKEIITDGRLALLSLKSCSSTAIDEPAAPTAPRSKLARIGRRMMLEGRQYALRGNAYYWAYRAVTFKRASKGHTESFDE